MSELIFILPGTEAVLVRATVQATSGQSFGCHCLTLANIATQIAFFRDPKKELTKDEWGNTLSINQVTAAKKYLIENEELRYSMWSRFSKIAKQASLVFMTAPCNTDDGVPDTTHHLHGLLCTAGFADYLRKTGEFIMGSPLLSNPQHQTSSFSLLRGWMWIPKTEYPGQPQLRHIEGTEYISGKMQNGLPFPEWVAHYYAFHEKTPLRDSVLRTDVGGSQHQPHLKGFTPDQLVG